MYGAYYSFAPSPLAAGEKQLAAYYFLLPEKV